MQNQYKMWFGEYSEENIQWPFFIFQSVRAGGAGGGGGFENDCRLENRPHYSCFGKWPSHVCKLYK